MRNEPELALFREGANLSCEAREEPEGDDLDEGGGELADPDGVEPSRSGVNAASRPTGDVISPITAGGVADPDDGAPGGWTITGGGSRMGVACLVGVFCITSANNDEMLRSTGSGSFSSGFCISSSNLALTRFSCL